MRVTRLHAFVAAAALAVLLASPATGETIESITTPFDVDKCVHKAGQEPEDEGEWRCVGYAGIPIVMTVGDARAYISYGARAEREPAAAQTLAALNGEGSSIEWRIVRDGSRKPRAFATIMRWSTAVPVDDPKVENGTYRGEVLVVTRLGPGGVCHVGYVDAKQNAKAVELAREIADRHARTFRCGKDKPFVLGDKGPGFSGPYRANK
ncbi:MAG TPA: hypothetical protein VKX28_13650 [Xanthobacteraceae bacterium]|nr:hypothetical protein [Xanthobacteraceae bacterium]